jgi:TetR/AcrR family transcriptional repressor of mexJK operon
MGGAWLTSGAAREDDVSAFMLTEPFSSAHTLNLGCSCSQGKTEPFSSTLHKPLMRAHIGRMSAAASPAESIACSQPEARPAKCRAVLDAAAALFLSQGYSVSMDAIARQAGVSKATLYAYFPGKEALFRAMVAEQCDRMAAEAAHQAGHGGEIRETLERLGLMMLRFFVAPSTLAVHRIVMAEASREPTLGETFYAAGPTVGRARLAVWIAEEQRRGRLRADADPTEAAIDFSAMLRRDLWLRAGLGVLPAPDEAMLKAEARTATELFLRCYGTGS